jgi:hypothetical protein
MNSCQGILVPAKNTQSRLPNVRRFMQFSAAVTLIATTHVAFAQSYPSKPIRIVTTNYFDFTA